MNIFILLDQSGSMANKWNETIPAINTYVKKLKEKTEKAKISLAAFDSDVTMRFNLVRDRIDLSEWKELSLNEITPSGMTPLYDAIGKMYTSVKYIDDDKTTVLIVTDGEENSSKEVNRTKAKEMIDSMKAKNWDVVFIGADFNNFEQSAKLGGNYGSTISMKRGLYDTAFATMAVRSANYASTGAVAEFTDEERKLASGS